MKRRALLLAAAVAAPARAGTLDEVLHSLAAVRESRARFAETKAIPELETTLPSRGLLVWRAPDYVEKHTLEPVEERLVVRGDSLTMERAGVRRVVALDAAPEIRALVEAIRGSLAGDRTRLEQFYTLRFSDAAYGWSMTLLPRSNRLAAAVQGIVLSGVGAQIRSVETQERGGLTRMLIEPLA